MKTISLLIMSVFALALVSAAWCNNADMNQDGMVDVGDLAILNIAMNVNCSLDNPAYNYSSSSYEFCCAESNDTFACCSNNSYCNGADMNADYLVDYVDFMMLNQFWDITNCSDEIPIVEPEPIPDPIPEPPAPVSSGGSGCDTTWNCSDWNECINQQQNRTCEKLRYSCDAGKKPELNQSCIISQQVTIVQPEPQEQVPEPESVPEVQETQLWAGWYIIVVVMIIIIIIAFVLASIRLLAKGKDNAQLED